jgi:hypothetical protein
MREMRSDGRNGSDQSENRKNIEDRLTPRRPLSDLESQVGHLAPNIRELGCHLGSQVSKFALRLGPQVRDLGLGLSSQVGDLGLVLGPQID